MTQQNYKELYLLCRQVSCAVRDEFSKRYIYVILAWDTLARNDGTSELDVDHALRSVSA